MGGLLFFSIADRGLHLFVYSLSSEAAGLSRLCLKVGTVSATRRCAEGQSDQLLDGSDNYDCDQAQQALRGLRRRNQMTLPTSLRGPPGTA